MPTDKPTTFIQLCLQFDEKPEEWRPVVGWESAYEVSNHGQVRSLDRPVAWRQRYGHSRETTLRQRMLKGQILVQHGYGRGKRWLIVVLWRTQKGTRRPVHQLVLEAFVGPRPPGYVTNHKDGNPANNRVENLEWCTVTENNRHALDTGLRRIRGEDHYHHRFTVEEVREMRRLRKSGLGPSAIARLFQASLHTVRKIVEYHSWKHVKD